MDLGSTIIGIVCLVLIIVPVLYFQRGQIKKRKKLLHDLVNLAEQQQLKISQYDFWGPFYAIGIDTDKKELLYTKRKEGKDQETLVDLSEVRQCSVNNISRDANGGRTIERIELVFTFKNAKYPEKTLEFYSREETLNLNEELKLSEKWRDIVNSNISATASNSYASKKSN